MPNRVHPEEAGPATGASVAAAAGHVGGDADGAWVPANVRVESNEYEDRASPADSTGPSPARGQRRSRRSVDESPSPERDNEMSVKSTGHGRRRSSLGDAFERAAVVAKSSLKSLTDTIMAGQEMARRGVMGQLWRSKTDKILQESPLWLNSDVLKNTKARLQRLPHSRHVTTLRADNTIRQTEQETWNILIWALQNPDQAHEALVHDKSPVVVRGQQPENLVEKKMFEVLLARQEEYMRVHGDGAQVAAVVVPGPVGDTPMHQCFLLGMVELGKKVVDAFYFNAHLMNTAYANDLAVWVQHGVINKDADDGGLYTGQTVLHIAINLKNYELMRFLLDRGADIVARATGCFFSPQWIRVRAKVETHERSLPARRRREKPIERVASWFKDSWKQFHVQTKNFIALLRGIEADKDAASFTYQYNESSACYYGEFPLSFAASLGEPAACSLLCAQFQQRRDAKDRHLMEFYDSLALRRTHEGAAFARAVEQMKVGDLHPAWRKDLGLNYFTNAQDRFGNTALHMAVMHGKKTAIEWLCVQGSAQPSLDILNEEGYTPLTLAVKQRNAKIFSFVLQQIRLCPWTYGGVQMIKTPLDQIDTFKIPHHPLHSSKRWRSALQIIVENEVEEFAHEEMFNNLVMEKWKRFGMRHYITKFFIPYIVYLILLSVCLYLRAIVMRDETGHRTEGQHMERVNWGYAEWIPFMWARDTPTQKVRLAGSVMETVLVVVGVPRLLRHSWLARRLKHEDLDPRMQGGIGILHVIKFVHKNMLSALLLAVAIMNVLAFISGLLGKGPFGNIVEIQCLSISIMLIYCGLLLSLMPFKFFGVLIITMWQMLTDGVFKFIVTYIILVTAFSQSLYTLFQLSDIPEDMGEYNNEPGRLFMKLVWVSFGDTRYIDEALVNSASTELSTVVYLVYLWLVMVLMLNLLIAMMAQAFETYMANAHITWFFPFAHLVFRLERMLSVQERVKFRVGQPGSVMDPASERFGSAIFYDIRIDKDETLRKHIKQKKAHKRERLMLQALEEQAVAPLERCREALVGIMESFRDIQSHR